MHRSRLVFTLVLVLMLSASVSMTSCGGGSGGTNPDLVLLGFNVPNLSGIALNQPLIFTFSASINPATITPDSLRVVGDRSPFFESIIVDGNLVALLPTVPNFADYEDAGYAPDTEYTISLSTFPAVTTIESTTGKPLLAAQSFTFRTLPAPSPDIVSNILCTGGGSPSGASFFIEPRRSVRHGVVPSAGGRSDDEGCVQNPDSDLFNDPFAIQTNSGPGARLLCLQNEGSPRVVPELSQPTHNQVAVGDASAVQPGLIDLPAIRVKINEPLDPLSVEPFFAGIPINVQLWRVALKDGTPTGPDQILTNKPIVNQDTSDTEIILVPAGPVPQGTFVVNITPAVKDLPGCPLRIDDRPDPAIGGYDVYEALMAFTDAIQPGYRIYFKTLEVPDTPLSIIEDFNNNLAEWGDNQVAAPTPEPGVFSQTVEDHTAATPLTFDGNPMLEPLGPFPALTRLFAPADADGAQGGQSTTALWNGSGVATAGGPISAVNGYRFLNIPTLAAGGFNPSNTPIGNLLHIRQPYFGTGQDGVFNSGGGGSTTGLNTDNGSLNGDGIYEYISFNLQVGDTVNVSGSKPLLILCRGDFTVAGTITLDGTDGSPGFDTSDAAMYTNAGSVSSAGAGGLGGPGGGDGGHGAETLGIEVAAPANDGNAGGLGSTLFESMAPALPTTPPFPTAAGGGGGTGFQETALGANDGSQGGGGGGFGANGSAGSTSAGVTTNADGGPVFGAFNFERELARFVPDRGYQPNANISGGTGGGGGGIEDDNGASEDGDMVGGSGDDGGGGGGGAGGALWVIARSFDILPTGVISANGGAGGNTWAVAEQLIDSGPDGSDPGGGGPEDDLFLGLAAGVTGTGTGDGGPGGGGAGGGIFLIGKGASSMTGTLSAVGGAGGTSGHATRRGGDGAGGRIFFAAVDNGVAAPALLTLPGSVSVGTGSAGSGTWRPTLEDMSVGQSEWVDLFTPTADFAPIVGGNAQLPTFAGNFQFPGAAFPGFLETPTAMGGGGQTYGFGGGTFDARLEFQGADFLNPEPAVGTPTTADGLTDWVDVSGINGIDMKRYFRWRWRFWTDANYGANPGDPASLPVPTIFDVTIPFIK